MNDFCFDHRQCLQASAANLFQNFFQDMKFLEEVRPRVTKYCKSMYSFLIAAQVSLHFHIHSDTAPQFCTLACYLFTKEYNFFLQNLHESSQRRETLLSLSTIMAAVTSSGVTKNLPLSVCNMVVAGAFIKIYSDYQRR